MKPVLAWTFPGGKLKQEVTSVVLVNNTLKVIDTTVPAGKQWKLIGVKALNIDDVDRTVTINVYKEAGKTNLLRELNKGALGANAGEHLHWPSEGVSTGEADHTSQWADIPLVPGNTINVQWAAGGASTGATDADGLVIEYLEIDTP